MTNGLNFIGDFANAGILFQQPNHEQSIRWYYGTREQGQPFTSATLTVSKEHGDLTFTGGDARFSGSVVTKGISGDEKPAKISVVKMCPSKLARQAWKWSLPILKSTEIMRYLSSKHGSAAAPLRGKLKVDSPSRSTSLHQPMPKCIG